MDVIAGLDMMVQRGQWDKAIETAEQQVGRTAFSILPSFNNRGDVLPCDNQNLNNNGTGLNSHIYISLQMALCQSKGAFRKSELGTRTCYFNVN